MSSTAYTPVARYRDSSGGMVQLVPRPRGESTTRPQRDYVGGLCSHFLCLSLPAAKKLCGTALRR